MKRNGPKNVNSISEVSGLIQGILENEFLISDKLNYQEVQKIIESGVKNEIFDQAL